MFFYFYDAFVAEKKYENELTRAENRLIELGINGRIEKLSVLKNSKEIIEDGIKKGAHTIVAVGDDATFAKVINVVANRDVIVGFVPMVSNSKFAKILGIPDSFEACNIISRRLIKKINLGKANQNYFLASLTFPEAGDLKIECDGKYSVSLREKNSGLSVYNLGSFLKKIEQEKWKVFSSRSNYLHVVVSPKKLKGFSKLFGEKITEKESVFPAKKIKISSEEKSLPVVLDEETTLKTPVNVTVRPKKVTLIMGKERMI